MPEAAPSAQQEPYLMILGGSDDPQLMLVIAKLKERGTPCLFLDYERPCDFLIDVDRSGRVTLSAEGQIWAPPSLVWSRLKRKILLGEWTSENVHVYVSRVEWASLYVGLCHLFEDRMLYSMRGYGRANFKITQFQTAGRLGFQIPESRMFVGKRHAQDMLDSHSRVVAKPIAIRNVPKLQGDADDFRLLQTMDVRPEDVAESDDAEFSQTPCFFQKRIESGTEYKITAFGDNVYACKIRQSVESRIRADERSLYYGREAGRSIYQMQYELVPTPHFLQNKIPAFLKEMGICYGTFDVIETPDQQYVFLECNPEGQWGSALAFREEEITNRFVDLIERRLSTNQPARTRPTLPATDPRDAPSARASQ